MSPDTSATPTWPIGLALVAVLVVGYALACWIAPFATCGSCEGSGGRAGRKKRCRRCRGKGRKLRLGRRVFNAVAAKRADIARD